MNMHFMSDQEIEKEIGQRIKTLRLNRNITQQELSENTQLSLSPIKSIEKGQGKISTLIALLREFDMLDNIDALIPKPQISPIQLFERQGKQRRRARAK